MLDSGHHHEFQYLVKAENSTLRYDTLSAPGGVVGAARTGADSSQLSEPAAARCPDVAA